MEERRRKGAEEREMLTTFLSQISKRAGGLSITERERKGFPMKTLGEVFYAGDGITAVVGDVEIPDGAVVDRPLVVKGKIKTGSNCQILKKLKALGGISIADGCLVRADLECSGIIELGKGTVIEGNVHAESSLKLSQDVRINGSVDAAQYSLRFELNLLSGTLKT